MVELLQHALVLGLACLAAAYLLARTVRRIRGATAGGCAACAACPQNARVEESELALVMLDTRPAAPSSSAAPGSPRAGAS